MKNKMFILLMLAGFATTNLFAQPVIYLQRTVGGNSGDYLRAFALTSDEGFIAGGESASYISGEKSEDSRGLEDYWIVKFDNHIKIQWQRTIGGSGGDGLSAIQQTTDGGYILGGSSESNISGEKIQNSRGGFDCWIIKLDNNGNTEWSKTIGGSGNDILSSIQQTSDGGYIIGASSESNISNEKTGNSRGGEDYWVIKLNASGNIQWDKTIGGVQPDYLSALQQTFDGGYILGGSSDSNKSGEKSEDLRGGFYRDFWVVKLNAGGSIEWDKTIGGNTSEELYALQQTRDSGYIIGGLSGSGAGYDKTENNKGGADYWIVKLTKKGNRKWDRTIGGSGWDDLRSIDQTTDGGYIVGGFSQSDASGDKTENRMGYDDYWVVKVTRRGDLEWEETLGGNESDELFVVKEIKNNVYLLGGISNSKVSGDKTRTTRGDYDYWFITLRFQVPVAISSSGKTDIVKSAYSAYPNPTKDILHVQTNAKATLTLTDQSGKILLTRTINGKGEMNVANLAAGLYYLKNNATGSVQKVVVEK